MMSKFKRLPEASLRAHCADVTEGMIGSRSREVAAFAYIAAVQATVGGGAHERWGQRSTHRCSVQANDRELNELPAYLWPGCE